MYLFCRFGGTGFTPSKSTKFVKQPVSFSSFIGASMQANSTRFAKKPLDAQGARSDWNAVLHEVKDRGGQFKAEKNTDIKAYIEPFSVFATYDSSFEKTEIKEIFILKRFDGQLRIFTYQTVAKPSGSSVP